MMPFLPLILACALLLCGCAGQEPPTQTLPAPEPVVLETVRREEPGGSLQTTPLNLRSVQGLHFWNGKLLLVSGEQDTILTLLEPDTLLEAGSLTLDFPPEQLQIREDGSALCHDPNRGELLLLGPDLSVLRKIPAPGAATALPVPEGNTLYYCTATHLRAWDLDTGIRRSLREMNFDRQAVTDVLLEGTVLQCTVTEAGETATIFLSADDGRLLHRAEGSCSVKTREDRYFATLPTGLQTLLLSGSVGEEPVLLTPEDFSEAGFFLPELDALLTLREDGDRLRLACYGLGEGSGKAELLLQGPRKLLAARSDGRQIFLLMTGPEDQALLLQWEPGFSEGGSYRSAYDHRDLSALEGRIRALEETYGIQILLGEEAAQAAPRDLDLVPEVLPAQLDRELTALEQRLSAIPEEILRQTAAHFSGLTLSIVRSIDGPGSRAEEPGAHFFLDGEACLVIPAGDSTGQALYHQLFHLMETRIFSRSKALDRWDELNPAGFRYDYDYISNSTRDSGVYLFEDHRAFADTYSMSFPREDRARILEYAMLPGQEELFRTEVMQKKLKALCTGIREAYGLKKHEGTLPWERYLE